MKNVLFTLMFSMAISAVVNAQSYDNRSGYYGDNFSLEGALDLFKKSRTLEDFEQRLNREDAWINNLDLNNDGRTDYIRVEHKRYDQNFHAVVLQVDIGRYDVQDIAVIEIQQNGNKSVDLQIVGDEDIYGNEIYVEPYGDNDRDVYRWQIVQRILDNQYQVYASPYRWNYYPTWYSPWTCVTYNIFRPRVIVYNNYYRVIHTPRFVNVHNYYKPQRTYCNNVVIYSNKVRVNHGQKTIDRPTYKNNNGSYYGSRRSGSVADNNRNNGQGRNYNSGENSTRNRDASNGDNNRTYRGDNNVRTDNNTRPQGQSDTRNTGRSGTETNTPPTVSKDKYRNNRSQDNNASNTQRKYDNTRNTDAGNGNATMKRTEKNNSSGNETNRSHNPQQNQSAGGSSTKQARPSKDAGNSDTSSRSKNGHRQGGRG